MHGLSVIMFGTVILSMVGCTTLRPETVVNPSEVSVKDALHSVGEGLNLMKASLDEGGIITGLLVDEIILNLNLTSSATDNKVLAVDISKTVESGTTFLPNLSSNSTESSKGDRVSTLTIKFKNRATADLKNLGQLSGQTQFEDPNQPDLSEEQLRELMRESH